MHSIYGKPKTYREEKNSDAVMNLKFSTAVAQLKIDVHYWKITKQRRKIKHRKLWEEKSLPCEDICLDQQPWYSRAWYWGTDQPNAGSLWSPNRSSTLQ